MNKIRRLVAVLATILLLSTGCAIRKTAQSPDQHQNQLRPLPSTTPPVLFVDAVDQIKKSIAPVVCVHPNANSDWQLESIEGTAVFISRDGSFITPNHVISGMAGPRTRPCTLSAIYIPDDGVWRRGTSAFRIHYASFVGSGCTVNTRLDMAYCSPVPGSMTMSVAPARFETAPQADGTPVAFSGFPLNNPIPLTTIGAIATYSSTSSGGTIVMDKTAWPGASGSPIYLQNGRVIGIVLARGTGDAAGLAYGRTVLSINNMLPTTFATAVK